MYMERRSLIKRLAAGILGVGGLFQGIKAWGQQLPLYSPHTKAGNLVFTAGKIANFEGDIGEHTGYILDEMEKELMKAGSSMEKVLKVNVYLIEQSDFEGMNAVYRGRFGDNPPARTTVTVKSLPGSTRVEIDCIAYR